MIKSISVVKGKGFGYVCFENSQQAEEAIIGMRTKPFKGQILEVDLYESKKPHKEGGRPSEGQVQSSAPA